MKCKNWSNKLNNFVVRKLKSFKISGQQQVLSTMPAMPKEKSSPVPLADSSNYSDIMKERLVSTSANMTAIPANYSKVSNELMMSSSMSSKTPTTNEITNSSITNGTSEITNQSEFRINNGWETGTYETKIKYPIKQRISPTVASQQVEFRFNRISTTNNSVPSTTSSSKLTQPPQSQKPSTPSRTTLTPPPPTIAPAKKSPNDYVFGKFIGEGSYSTVYLARDIHTHREYAIKVCDKQHILREGKQEYIKREREVMHVMNNVPGFVNLSCTFQDHRNLYFVMTYAKNSDLLPYINKVGSFDLECTCQYAAELVLAIENMHKRGVVHRDLKPENILLDENMHTLIADFGSAKILATEKTNNATNVAMPAAATSATTTANNTESPATPTNNANNVQNNMRRRGSFVGTAQYVSPEVLQGKETSKAADLWALGCIIYQMTSGLPPFRGGSDYLIFKEIMNLNLVFPEGFDKNAEDLVRQLLRIHPEDRIGAQDKDGRYESIRTHPFFEGINWDTVLLQTPPQIYPYLPGVHKDEELRSHYCVPHNLEPGLDDRQLTRLLGLELGTVSGCIELETKTEPENNFNLTETEKKRRLELQKTDKWNQFCDGEVILKKGFVNKRKGLFARKRMFLMTTGPRLIYIDPVQMVKKGEIPWSKELRVEPKNFKIFFVHTPNRTYYLEDPEGYALEWVKEIENVRQNTYGDVS